MRKNMENNYAYKGFSLNEHFMLDGLLILVYIKKIKQIK